MRPDSDEYRGCGRRKARRTTGVSCREGSWTGAFAAKRVVPEPLSGGLGTHAHLGVCAHVTTVSGTEYAQVTDVARTRVGFGEQESNVVGMHRLHGIAFWTWRTSVPLCSVANSTTALWSNSRCGFPASPTNGRILLSCRPVVGQPVRQRSTRFRDLDQPEKAMINEPEQGPQWVLSAHVLQRRRGHGTGFGASRIPDNPVSTPGRARILSRTGSRYAVMIARGSARGTATFVADVCSAASEYATRLMPPGLLGPGVRTRNSHAGPGR